MDWQVRSEVRWNSADYFEKALITDNGFREYDVRWLCESEKNPKGEINPNGFVVLGRAYGTYVHEVLGENYCGGWPRLPILQPRPLPLLHPRPALVGNERRGYRTGALAHPLLLAISLEHQGRRHVDRQPQRKWLDRREARRRSLFHARSRRHPTLPRNRQTRPIPRRSGKLQVLRGHLYPVSRLHSQGHHGRQETPRPLEVVLAAGNGTAGRFVPDILKAIGCKLTEVDCDLDWNFPHHNPNPEDIKFLHSIGDATRKHVPRSASASTATAIASAL